VRAILTRQSEHHKLVGTLAMLWGNEDFDMSPVERNSMIAGMGLHARYHEIENKDLLENKKTVSGCDK